VEKYAKESKEAAAKASSTPAETTRASTAPTVAANRASRSQSPSRKVAAAETGMSIDDIPGPEDPKVR
jgi:hypothetical protein